MLCWKVWVLGFFKAMVISGMSKMDWILPLFLQRPATPSKISSIFEQFQSLLEDIHDTTENLLIIGNFNFHLKTTCSNSKTLYSLIDSFDLNQKVNFQTHIHGHTLDLVLTKSTNDNISNVHTTDA